MRFRSASAHNFRLLRNTEFELHPRLNYFVGGNGAGKTTILEALHVLARASSQRGTPQSLISDGETAWSLEAVLDSEDTNAPTTDTQVRWLDRCLSVEINHQRANLAELVRLLPVVLLEPLSHRIMDEGPGIRRRYMDWGAFHMEQSFHTSWVRMNRALRQRNAGLRAGASTRELVGWNQELVVAAQQVNELRQQYVDKLSDIAGRFWSSLLGQTEWRLRLSPGWHAEQDYGDVLNKNLDGDRKLGYTREGPHRAELQILSDNARLKDRISRGQQKLLVAALILAQSEFYRQQHGSAPVLMVDDFAAELSTESQSRLLREFSEYAGQVVIAALDYNEVFRQSGDHFVFHMEHGHITNMIQKA